VRVPAGESADSVILRSVDGTTDAEFVPQANTVCTLSSGGGWYVVAQSGRLIR
jgi:hypothetical protein